MKEDSNPVEENNQETPDWLKAIQLNSWEAELLVSALVLYALFQIPDLITEFSLRNFANGSLFHKLFNIVTTAINLLKVGYTLHILVRGLWVASIGLSYVFPKGIDQKRLKFKGRFGKEIDSKKSLVLNVLRLEELSSIIYGITFLLFGSMLGVGMLMFLVILATEVLVPNLDMLSNGFFAYVIFILVYFILLFLLLVDFLSNGLFRKIEWVAVWFYPIAAVFRVLTLSFLYRRSLLVLISNTKGWKAHLIPFIVLIVCVSTLLIRNGINEKRIVDYLDKVQTTSVLKDNYENLRTGDDQLIATIQSDIVSENVVRLFLRDIQPLEIAYRSDTSKSKTSWGSLSSDSASHFINKWVSVKIDDNKFDNLKWFVTQHHIQYSFGFIVYLDLDGFEKGVHNLSIEFSDSLVLQPAKRNINGGVYARKHFSNIHFFYDKQ